MALLSKILGVTGLTGSQKGPPEPPTIGAVNGNDGHLRILPSLKRRTLREAAAINGRSFELPPQRKGHFPRGFLAAPHDQG